MSDIKNDSLDKMLEQFQSVEELKTYSSAQYKTILKLNKTIQELKRSNQELEEKSKVAAAPQIVQATYDMGSKLSTSDEEAICIVQLRMMRDVAMSKELTKEEAQKVEIYAKTLNLIRNIPKKVEVNTKDMSNDQLLSLIDETITKAN